MRWAKLWLCCCLYALSPMAQAGEAQALLAALQAKGHTFDRQQYIRQVRQTGIDPQSQRYLYTGDGGDKVYNRDGSGKAFLSDIGSIILANAKDQVLGVRLGTDRLESLMELVPYRNITSINVGGWRAQTTAMLSSLRGISRFKQLRELIMTDAGITHLKELSNIDGLRYLDVSNNKLIDLSGIERHKNILRINLSMNPLRSIRPLAGLKKLKWLTLSDNPIEDLSPLIALT